MDETTLLKSQLQALESWLADFRCCGTILAIGINGGTRYFACSKCGAEWLEIKPR